MSFKIRTVHMVHGDEERLLKFDQSLRYDRLKTVEVFAVSTTMVLQSKNISNKLTDSLFQAPRV